MTGLTYSQVKDRIEKGQVNKAAKPRSKTVSEILIENIFSIFNIIIFGIILFVLIFYFLNNDIRLLLDSIGILSIAVINTFIAVFQEIRSKKALDKVNLLLKKQVTVIREGKNELIDITDIVVGDIILISRGDQIVVDGKVIEPKKLEIDESLLTGESIPIEKSENEEILSGSFCVAGSGYYRAEKIGNESYANSVTSLAKKYKFVVTPLQRKINLILKVLFGVALLLVGLEVLNYYTGFSKPPIQDSVEFVRKIATILISLVPQGLVLMASVTFALGVYRISKIGAIVQRLNAIESFSNVQVVCMDKTGTLTENKLKVHSVTNLNQDFSSDELKKLLGTFSNQSSEKNATIRALDGFEYYKEAIYIEELPFNSTNKLSILKLEIGNDALFYILGAYDILCEQMPANTKDLTKAKFDELNLRLYRNLLFGKVTNIGSVELKQDELGKLEIEPYCIVSISDTVRHDVHEALELFTNNGIKFKILSGDSGEAIAAVLKEIGWDTGKDDIISGKDIDKLSDKEFEKCVFDKFVFARLKPEHKLRIIDILKKNKVYTAMIGDGVNDLPAIKRADMGIAMEEGSSITKEVADIVLLKNKFSLLPQIFDEGNKIVNSVNSVAKLFLTKNFIVIYLSLLSLIFLTDFPLTPRRVSLLNIFAIGLPSLLLTLKNDNISKCRIFTKDVFSFVVLSSIIINAGGYTAHYLAARVINSVHSEAHMVTMTVIILLSVINFIIVATETGQKKGIFLIYGVVLITAFTAISMINKNFILIKFFRVFYEIQHLEDSQWWIIAGVTIIASLVLYFGHKVRERIVGGLVR